jgi:hypothetical protein
LGPPLSYKVPAHKVEPPWSMVTMGGISFTQRLKMPALATAPAEDTPEAIAAFVQKYADQAPLSATQMYSVVNEGHSLHGLIAKMDSYMHKGD